MKLFRSKAAKLLTILGINASVLTAAVVISTISWYQAKQEILPSTKIKSSILTSYFDESSGDGTFGHPYVITKPLHFYNLSRLYAAGYDFDDETYFQIGKKNIGNSGNTDYKVYDFNDNGTIKDGQYSKVLNMSFYDGSDSEHPAIVPIGTSNHPFKSHINGCNITVDSITINGQGYSDIGIFGYVDDSATIRNLYFDNILIDTKIPVGTDAYHSHTDSKYNIGYLAGHIVSEESFNHVFINNAEATNSAAPTVIGKTHYGIFGACDSASTPMTNTSVDEYRINPNTVHSYMNSNYTALTEKGVATRDTEYSVSSTAFSTAFTQNNSQYDLKGKSSGSSYNYSLSTIGHQGMDSSFDISYGNSHSNMLATTQVLAAGIDINDVDDPGTYMYYDTSSAKWKYYVITAGGSTSSVTFNVFTLSFEQNSTTYYVYFDSSTDSLKATASSAPTISNKNYWFCFKESLASNDVGVTSLASVGSNGRYYIYVPSVNKYLYITGSTTLNAGSATDVSALSGSGNTGSFAIDSIDSAITWTGTYESNHSTVFGFQGNTTAVSIVRPVSGNEATEFAINGSGSRVPSSTTASEEFQLITDVSQITNQMKVGIGYPNLSDDSYGYYLMSTTQQTNNRGTVTTTVKEGTTLNCVSSAVKLTVTVNEQQDKTLQYSLFDPGWNNGAGGYLVAPSSSSNFLRTQSSEVNWTITINGSSPYNAVITCQNNTTRNLMRFNYNNGSPIFACYSSGQQPICLYKYYQTSGTLETAEAASLTVSVTGGNDVSRMEYAAYYDNDASGLTDWREIDFARSRITWDFPNHQIVVAPLADSHWEKITSTDSVTDGDYLIVNEAAASAFNGGIDSETYDTTGNRISGLTISNNRIAYDATTEAAKFTYNTSAHTLKSAKGYYVGRTNNSTGINASKTTVYTNTITFNGSDVVITSENNYILRYNSASDQNRFRYYSGNSVQAIQLYKLITESNDPEYIADDIEDLDANYDHTKIDVVGDASFTSSAVVLSSNLSNTKAISKWHADNAADGIGSKFYQTKYLGNSIVFFIPNQGTFDFGTIHFVCTSTEAPVFIKGTHAGKAGWESSIGFSDPRICCDNDSGSSGTYNYTLSLNKYNIFNLSYAALDSSGNIASCYDADGAQVLPSSSTVALNSISTFVLAITVPSSSMSATTINLKINHIEGSVANFSNVGYRTAAYSSGVASLDDEEFNVVTSGSVVDMPSIIYRFDTSNANNRIYEKMVYSDDGVNKIYRLTFKCSVTTTLVIFNFDAERAKLYINDNPTPYKESYHSINVTGTTWYA